MQNEKIIILEEYLNIELELVLIEDKVDEYRVVFNNHEYMDMYFTGDNAFSEALGLFLKSKFEKQLELRLG